jgi:hypothetical protein
MYKMLMKDSDLADHLEIFKRRPDAGSRLMSER